MPAGRPTKYKPEYAEQAFKLCLLLGATDAQLAGYFEVQESTINDWKLKYPEFSESIKKGKEDSDFEVAHSLYWRARGYSHPETKAQWVKDYVKDEETGQMVEVGRWETLNMIKHYPPDTAAAFIWLKNRQGLSKFAGEWRDKQELEHSGTVTHEHITANEARRKVKERLARLLDGRRDSGVVSGNGRH